MSRAKLVILVFVSLVLLVSCTPVPADFSCKLPDASTPPPKSGNLAIAIYLDGTPSMEGYVSSNTKSRYAQTLDLLDSTFYLSSSNVKYNRLGTRIQPISREQFQKDSQSPKFYNGSNSQYPLFLVSQIEKAFQPIKNDSQLSIIITDLYQKNTDITKLSQEIKKSYLNPDLAQKGYAVGIMAIKSEFKGTVYTEEDRQPKFSYTTENKQTDKFHPFFVIFLGKYSDINYYFSKLNPEESKFLENSKLVIFSPQFLLKEVLHFQDVSPEISSELDIKRPPSLNNGKVVVYKSRYVELLEIRTKAKQEIPIKYNMKLSKEKYTLMVKENTLETIVNAQGFDNRKKVDKNNNSSLKESIKIGDFLIDKSDTDEQQKLNFTTKINPNQIKPGVYFFTIDVIPKDLQEQTWWEEWGSTYANITDGSKTYNLAKFLRELKNLTTDSMTQASRSNILGHFCYSIQRN